MTVAVTVAMDMAMAVIEAIGPTGRRLGCKRVGSTWRRKGVLIAIRIAAEGN